MLFYGLATLALSAVAFAQDLGVPTSWREFSNKYTLAQRQATAKAGIDVMTTQQETNAEFIGVGYWGSAASVYSSMANYDHYVGTTYYESEVLYGITAAFDEYAHFDQYGYNDDALWWATAAYYAYRAYGDANMLYYAAYTWNAILPYQITAAQAAASSTPVRSFGIQGSCSGVSNAGAVFWRPTASDTGINSVTTGLFLTLSAYLAQAYPDQPEYLNAAIAGSNWIRTANTNADYIALDTINSQDCSRSPSTWLFTYNTGKYLEGTNIIAHLTGDSTLLENVITVANAAMKTTAWQGSNGVITEGNSPSTSNDSVFFKSAFVRALNEVFLTNENISGLNTLIHSYLTVQYNALLELAAEGNYYSSSWAGPAQGYNAWGQAAALDCLVAGITSTT